MLFYVYKICRKVMSISIKLNVSSIKVYKKEFKFKFEAPFNNQYFILI